LGPPRRRSGRPKSYRWRSEAGSNVLLDVLQNDAAWAPWSQEQLDAAAATESLAINPIIYSELSMAFARIEELDTVIEHPSISKQSLRKPCFSPARFSSRTVKTTFDKHGAYLST
jgi:hypothetical protein